VTFDDFCFYGSAIVLAVAAVLVLLRTVLGPTVLDRSIGLDTLSAICLAAIAVDAAQHRDGEFLPMLLLLALVGFTGSVCIARFSARGGRESGGDVSGEDGCFEEGDRDTVAGCLPELPETGFEKRRERGL
jgi:multicomponent Na+:H+ antiporter subunit F